MSATDSFTINKIFTSVETGTLTVGGIEVGGSPLVTVDDTGPLASVPVVSSIPVSAPPDGTTSTGLLPTFVTAVSGTYTDVNHDETRAVLMNLAMDVSSLQTSLLDCQTQLNELLAELRNKNIIL